LSKRHNPKALLAIQELVIMCVKCGCHVEFVTPTEIPQEIFGGFVTSEMKIYIYKDRPVPINAGHAFVLAHEYQHLQQFLTMKHPQNWLAQIGAIAQTASSIKDDLEKDADEYATKFLKERGMRVPNKMLTSD
jgi:hypothetical protein